MSNDSPVVSAAGPDCGGEIVENGGGGVPFRADVGDAVHDVENAPEANAGLLVHLVRHGETASYGHDAGLTNRGRAQVRHRGMELARILRNGERVGFGYAPTERARLTAELLRDTIMHETGTAGVGLVGATIGPEPGYRNVQVWADGEPREPTQTRARLDELVAAGETARFGWAVEAQRFWRAHDESGNAMTFWLSTPLVWHEAPGSVVGRVTRTTREKLGGGQRGRLVVGCHSGVLRAIVQWVSGTDPGEPENAEEVVIVAAPGSDQVTISYRDRQWSMQIPTSELNWNLGLTPSGRCR
jgi:broad specificity phosphatase PhoE